MWVLLLLATSSRSGALGVVCVAQKLISTCAFSFLLTM